MQTSSGFPAGAAARAWSGKGHRNPAAPGALGTLGHPCCSLPKLHSQIQRWSRKRKDKQRRNKSTTCTNSWSLSCLQKQLKDCWLQQGAVPEEDQVKSLQSAQGGVCCSMPWWEASCISKHQPHSSFSPFSVSPKETYF